MCNNYTFIYFFYLILFIKFYRKPQSLHLFIHLKLYCTVKNDKKNITF